MRSDTRKRLRIELIDDLKASKDALTMLLHTKLHAGSDAEPVRSSMHGPDHWIYKGHCVLVEGAEGIPEEDLKFRIKFEVLKHAREMQQIRRSVEAFENLDQIPSARRERIPSQ